MRFARSVIGLLIVALGGISIMVVFGLRTEGICLLYDTRDGQGGDLRSIDIADGRQFIYDHGPAELPPMPSNGDISGDGRYQLYLTGPQNGPYSLYLDSQPLRQPDGLLHCFAIQSCWIGESPPHPDARLLTSGIQQHFVGTWLDNQTFFYTVPVGNQRQTLVIENVDRSTKHTLPMTFDQGDKIYALVLTTPLVFLVNDTDIYVWFPANNRVVAFPGATNSQSTFPALSPQGKYLTFENGNKLVILSVTTKARYEFIPQGQLIPPAGDWSPDERYFVLEYVDNANQDHAVLYSLNGPTSLEVKRGGYWTADSRTYFYLTATGLTSDINAVHIADGHSETVLHDAARIERLANDSLLLLWQEKNTLTLGNLNMDTEVLHVVSDGITEFGGTLLNGSSVVYWSGHGDEYSTEIVDDDGSNHRVLTSGSSMSEPTLINAGKSILYFADRNGTFNLEMINLDGTEHRILVTGLETYYSVNVWKDGKYLEGETESPDLVTFVGKRNGSMTAEIYLPQSGVHRILGKGLAAINNFTIASDIQGVSFAWQDSNKEVGIDGYSLDGKRVYHIILPGQSSEIAALGFYHLLSPDQHMVALAEQDPSNLYFMAADGSWTKTIRTDMGISVSPIWSPDGKLLAFGGTDTNGTYISVIDTNGQEIRRVNGVLSDGRLTWNHCEY